MKGVGIVVAIIGIIIGLVAVANYTVLKHGLFNAQHMDLIVGVVGLVVLIIGIILAAMGGRGASAA